MEYQIEMVYTREDIAAFVKVLRFRQRPEKNLRLAMKIGYPIFGVLLLSMGALVLGKLILAGLLAPLTIVVSVGCLLGGVLLLRRSDTKGMERRSWKKYPNKGMKLTYSFCDDYFEEQDEASGKNQFRYLSIKSANEDPDHFYLFTVSNAAHILKKGDFIVGDPKNFSDFLKKKAAVLVDSIEE